MNSSDENSAKNGIPSQTEQVIKSARKHRGEIIVLKPSPLMVLPRSVVAILLMAVVDYFAVLYPWAMVDFGTLSIFEFHLPIEFPILHFIPLAILFSALHKLYDERYYIDDVCVIERTGIFSFKRKTIELDYCNMRASEVDQTWYESFCNIGKILLGTSGTGLGEITMRGVRNPHHYKKLIEKRILRARHDPVESDSVFVPGRETVV